MEKNRTVILQSHRSPAPSEWLRQCMVSVKSWAAASGFEYHFADDKVFDRLPVDIADKLLGGPVKHVVVATDLARLYWLQAELDSGAEAALWLDADSFVFDPKNFTVPEARYALGREVWVQPDEKGRLRSYKKVHNAFLLFRQGNPFLPYYLHAAEQIVRQHHGRTIVPQLVGPKLLTALHNVVQCPVAECAAMLSPAVVRDILAGEGKALSLFLSKSVEPPAAVNLCGSSVAADELTEAQMLSTIRCLSSVFL